MIDSKQASEALAEIDDIVQRVRQSRIYDLASQMMIMWGVLVFVANMATWLWPPAANYYWLAVYVLGIAGSFAISAANQASTGVRSFDMRVLFAFLMFVAFGFLCAHVLGHFTPRQQGTFWTIYFMLFYALAGLWFGACILGPAIGAERESIPNSATDATAMNRASTTNLLLAVFMKLLFSI